MDGTHGTAKVGGKTIALGKWGMAKPQPVAVEPAPAVSDDLQALLAAVAANPDDDTARLVYADALDENEGRATERAELIRVQCRRAAVGECPHRCLPGDPPCPECDSRGDLRERELALARTVNAALWAGGAPVGTQWSRGFIVHVDASWLTWRSHGDGLRAREWVPAVALTSRPDWLAFPTRGKPGAFEYEIAGAWVPVGVVGYLTQTHDERLCELLARRWPGTKFELPKPAPALPGYAAYGDADGGFLVPHQFMPQALFAITPELLADSGVSLESVLSANYTAAMTAQQEYFANEIQQFVNTILHGDPNAATPQGVIQAAANIEPTDDTDDDDVDAWEGL